MSNRGGTIKGCRALTDLEIAGLRQLFARHDGGRILA